MSACTGPSEQPQEGTGASQAAPSSSEIFVDRTAEAGLDFVHFNGMAGDYSIVEVMGGGGALFDYDGDGDLDLYLVQGRMLDDGKTTGDALFAPRHGLPLTDRLYRNELAESGTLRFIDVTAASGLQVTAGRGYGIGVTAGDYDNDGWTDLYVTAYGANQLLRNAGGKTFHDVTTAAGAGDERWSVPAVFFDYDRDGWLDLWIGNYVAVPAAPPVCYAATGELDWCGPQSFAYEPDRLLRNRGGDGVRRPGNVTFEDVTAQAGLAGAAAPSLGAVAADLDGDGWLDLYVANDGEPNFLWLNQGRAADGPVTFVDEALLAGSALNAGGRAEGSMGVDAADFDGDGDLDLFMTHLVTETNTLYLNDGRGLFDDATALSGLGAPSRLYTSFGTAATDYDNDGWEDLLVVNGAVNRREALLRAADPFPLHQPNQLFRNLGGGRFEEVTARAGGAFELSEVSRGALFGDVDNDGDADVVVVNNNAPARLLINAVGQDRPWLGVRLVGQISADPGAPRDMLGARAALLRGGEPVRWRRLAVDGSFASANDPRILFGLGDDPSCDGVRVFWPDGTMEDFPGVPAGRYTTLRQGEGRPPP